MWPFSKSDDEEEEWDAEKQSWVKKKKEKKKTTLRDENVQKVIKADKASKANTIKAIFDEK